MRFWKKKKPKLPFDGIPEWKIYPIAYGRWAIGYRDMVWLIKSGPFYYIKQGTTYPTKEEAEADAKHMGLKLPPTPKA